MYHYLVFGPIGADARNPMILGAVVVPPCFEPNDALIDAAEARGLDLFLMEGPDGAVPDHLLNMGERLLERCQALTRAHLN